MNAVRNVCRDFLALASFLLSIRVASSLQVTPVTVEGRQRTHLKSTFKRSVTERQNEAKFEDMVANFLDHRPADLDVDDPRLRVLLHSVQGTFLSDQLVVRAFKILYTDIRPIRIAGDLMFRQLDRAIFTLVNNEEVDECVLRWGEEEVVNAERIFRAIDRNKDGTVTSGELTTTVDVYRSFVPTPRNEIAVDETFDQSILRFMSEIDLENKSSMTFSEFMACGEALGYPNAELFGDSHEIDCLVDVLLSSEAMSSVGYSAAGQKFDAMCAEFSLWETPQIIEKAKKRNPRFAEVLIGCFSGSRNETVLRALKILYEDYRPLRMGGDLIFKVMKKLIQ